jgi:hypothetical protein
MVTPLASTGLALQGGQLQTIPGTANLSDVIIMMNDIINELNTQLQTQVLSDATSKRWLNGYQKGGWPGGDFGMKLSRPGVDVTTCAFTQLLFGWDFTTGTQYWYDSNGKNYMQEGILPDGSDGWVVATPNNNVNDIYS